MKTLALASGTTFVLAWLAGLVLAGRGPALDDSGDTIAAHFEAHALSAGAAHLFIDGVAGGARIALAFVVRRLLADQRLGRIAFAGVPLGSTAVYALLYVTLPLLLAWVMTTPVVISRRDPVLSSDA
jgi:hypothetical protein